MSHQPFILSEMIYQVNLLQNQARHLFLRVHDYREFRNWMASNGLKDYGKLKGADEYCYYLNLMLCN